MGTVRSLLSAINSSLCTGTRSVSSKSPVAAGRHRRVSSRRPMAGRVTVLLTSSPADGCNVTVVSRSRGSALSMMNGMRKGLPTTPNVGASARTNSMSGRRDSLPTATAKTGMFLLFRRLAARTGGSPVFQSPSEINVTPRRCSWFSRHRTSASYRSVPSLGSGSRDENDSKTTSSFRLTPCHRLLSASCSAHCRRVCGVLVLSAALITSRVCMLPDVSCNTTWTGRCSGS